MRFEFDPSKSASNRAKHGVDFLAAQDLWRDPALLEIPAQTAGEPRFLVIGRIHDNHWSAVITYRQQTVRLISVRRSRPEEVDLYEQL
ncbi:BrnT family toxin [Vulcanococcus limneticus Candia 3F8]|uniref:BrnT family toxin n=1 Tax=Vulcanococcus limneticus TaxID=2170428 RepID=UPI000B98BB42|nr:BrnT family toxin [Vulcanococcus limneticus]MCP9793599.1 BrnT family toxin [Vulcanococcus limneticus MW73D5]MCP9895487.1 BrnT family toxin [Vulcanococcus limneticus Candia 3F8]MCP9898943.1 BrnT family toxin [Vulcanococcus limneticus Candia 3B3]